MHRHERSRTLHDRAVTVAGAFEISCGAGKLALLAGDAAEQGPPGRRTLARPGEPDEAWFGGLRPAERIPAFGEPSLGRHNLPDGIRQGAVPPPAILNFAVFSSVCCRWMGWHGIRIIQSKGIRMDQANCGTV